MQSKATKLRIKFNNVRRAARWKKPNARFILISRDLREPTAVPWQPMIETPYKDLADFMKRGWDKGHVYVFPIRGRQPGAVYEQLMDRLASEPEAKLLEEELYPDLMGLNVINPPAPTDGEDQKPTITHEVFSDPYAFIDAFKLNVPKEQYSLEIELKKLDASLSTKGPTRAE